MTGLDAANADGNVPGLAQLLFSRYVFAFEVTSALLITAAIGAMVLAHRERLTPKPSQAQLAAQRLRDYADHGKHLGPLPAPGVFARHNAVDTPALLPDGTPAESSVSRVLAARGTVRNAPTLADDITVLTGRMAQDVSGTPADRSDRHRHRGRTAHERDAVPGALRDPVHDRLRRGAHPPQRDRGVHVRRADAQRLATSRSSPSPASTATSTGRSPPSS